MNLRSSLLLSLLLLSCGDDDEPEAIETVRPQPAAPDSPPARADRSQADPATQAPPLFTRNRRLMGTVFIIKVDAPPEVASPAVRAAFDEIARLEDVLSEWREATEISRINREAGGAPIVVSDDTFAVIDAGVSVSRWSHGAFDLSWAALRGLYDFRPGHRRIPDPEQVAPRLPRIDWRKIAIDRAAQSVRLGREDMAIGTGGIAKGYALDRAGDILRAAGIESYMIFGGGQVQVHGLRAGRPWRIGIQHPRRPDSYFAFFETEGGSISTSGDYEHFHIDEEGRRWHHILDTDTGLPARRSVSVTLLAESGLYADALSTAVFILGPERGLQMLAELPFRAEAVVLDADCKLHTTPGSRERLIFRVELEQDRIPGCTDAP